MQSRARLDLSTARALLCCCAAITGAAVADHSLQGEQPDLFGSSAPALPAGLRYAPDFLTRDEERSLLATIESLPLQQARYKAYTARRRVASFGGRYDFDDNRLLPGEPLPEALKPLRERAARWAGLDADALQDVLVAEYRPGTPLGWHRDVPDFEFVIGVSLLGSAQMRFRRYPPLQPKKADVVRLELPPRSIYSLQGEARWGWQHSIAPTRELRYSITLRTRRQRSLPRG
jgi:alkylated DNA repair dioxygenase AlkB